MEKTAVRCPSCHTGLSVRKTSESQSLTCPRCRFQGTITQFPEIEMKKLMCPKCKVILFMDPQYKGTIVCPKCQHAGDASAYPAAPLHPPVAASQRPPAEDDSVATDMPVNLSNKRLSRPGILVRTGGDVPAEPRMIILKKGVHTLGRGPQSSIQIDTADEFMSRVHARIELVVKGDDTFEHLLSDAGSRNGTYHNGDRIGKNETVVLCLNDLVRIGHTTYQFILE